MNVLSLCSGIGGIELGLRQVLPHRVVCYVERDPFAQRILEKQFGDAPIWPDLISFDGRPWAGKVDLVTAGFPCQPFSSASRGRKVAVDLWPEVRRILGEVEPGKVFLENVSEQSITRAGEDLEDVGFLCKIARISASEVGAAHRRPRWWLLADADDQEQSTLGFDAEVACLRAAARSGWETLPDQILGVDDGVSDRVDRLRCLGNSVVPAQSALAWKVLTA